MAQLTKGSKATSESARSAASRMEELMLQMGQEQVKLEKAREAEKRLMRRENRLLRRTVGMLRRNPEALAQRLPAPEQIQGRAVGSQQDVENEDLEALSRPSSAQQRD